MNPHHATAPPPPSAVHDAAFEFVRQLATELSGPGLKLPGYPEVALRVQKMLSDDGVSSDPLVRVLGAEPTLAARVLTIANSAAFNLTGKPVSDLRTAVVRLGFDTLRTAVISFAMAQQREASAFKGIQRPLQALWQHSVEVSALCSVLARASDRFNPDTALLTGVVSGVGKLYILTRAPAHPALFADAAAYGDIVREWHANIAQALLESWQMPDEIVAAVRDYEATDTETRRHANLADLLATAHLLVAFKEAPDVLQVKAAESPPLARLGFDTGACERLLKESADEVIALRAALGS